jgi:hypothetical protein
MVFRVDDIPVKLRDSTLHVGVEWYAFCIVLRLCIGLGLLIYNSWLLEKGRWVLWSVIGLMVFTGLGFLKKYIDLGFVWKVYMRYIVMAVCVIILVGLGMWMGRSDLISIAGIFVIVDVLMGIQSRYITMNMNVI